MKKLVSVCARTKEVRPTRRERTHNAMEGRRLSEWYWYDAEVRERQMGYDDNLYLGGGQVKGDTGECYLCLSQTADLGRKADIDNYPGVPDARGKMVDHEPMLCGSVEETKPF